MKPVYGLGRYFGFVARRERIMSPVWIICIAGFALIFTAMYPGLFPDKESMLIMAATMNTPAMVALMGPVYGMEAVTPAILMAQKCLLWFAVAIAVMNIFFVNRHTRMDEELGRHELLRALPFGRLTPAASTLLGAVALNAAIAVITAVGIIALNIEGTTAAGAWVYALSLGAQGLLFAALTLLAAQIFSTSRAALGSGFALLGLFYVMRMFGDMSGNVLSSISPMGLGLRVSAFYENHFEPIWILLAEAAAVGCAALAVCVRRDLGEGVLPARKGRRHASRFLQGEFGLAWRLSRGMMLAWSAGMLVMGVTYGSVLDKIDTFVSGNEMIQKILSAAGDYDIASNYIVLVFAVGALLAAVPVISILHKIRTEEKQGRLDQLFSKSVPREKMLLSYLILAFLESVAALVLLAAGLYGAAQGTGMVELGALMKDALVYLPALWVMIGLCTLLIGAFPKLVPLIWVVFAFSFMMTYFGALFDFPDWAHKLSPFGNIPQLPVQEFSVVPLVVMTLLAVVLAVTGVIRYRQRDIS